jgi:ATP phosphoribosyltransferase
LDVFRESSAGAPPAVRLALPKGAIEPGVNALLADAGIELRAGARSYRPQLSLDGFEAKVLKPQNVVEMVHAGSRDLGFAGADWIAELDANVVELLDTGLDPVRIVAAAPEALLENGALPARPLVVASEYARLAANWIERRRLAATLVRSYGATEVFPPEDADVVVDNSASGSTLRANRLVVVDELLTSSTRLVANPRALDDLARRAPIERLVVLLRSVLEARRRVLLEVNVPAARLDAVLAALPAMRQPTIASLAASAGFAVKAAVPRAELPRLIPELKARGATDLVVTSPSQIVP